MKIVKVSDVKKKETGPNPLFHGKVETQPLIGDHSTTHVGIVSFSPGAGNVFHTHTFDQVLYVTEGEGIVATEKEEIKVSKGTVIMFPAGEKHWHGATKDSSFAHLTFGGPGETKH